MIRRPHNPAASPPPGPQGRLSRPARSLGIALLAMVVIVALPGCRAGPKDFDNENDDLRRRVVDLESEVNRLRAERNEFESQLIELARVHQAGSGDLAADVIAALPRCAGIRIGRYSGLADRDHIPGPDTVDIYVTPYDGRQRFVQVVGRLTAEVALLPPLGLSEQQGEPQVIARHVLSPAELRDAYRSSPAGTHYSLRLPIDPAARPEGATLVIRVELLDVVSGLAFDAQYVPANP